MFKAKFLGRSRLPEFEKRKGEEDCRKTLRYEPAEMHLNPRLALDRLHSKMPLDRLGGCPISSGSDFREPGRRIFWPWLRKSKSKRKTRNSLGSQANDAQVFFPVQFFLRGYQTGFGVSCESDTLFGICIATTKASK